MDLLFFIFMSCCSKMVELGTPFKIRWDQTWHPNRPCGAKMLEKDYAGCYLVFKTLFSRNHSNPPAVVTSWRLKGHLFDGDWLISFFYGVSLSSVLYNILITFFQNTLVNAQPLSPSFFEEIAVHGKIYVFVLIVVFACFISYFC